METKTRKPNHSLPQAFHPSIKASNPLPYVFMLCTLFYTRSPLRFFLVLTVQVPLALIPALPNSLIHRVSFQGVSLILAQMVSLIQKVTLITLLMFQLNSSLALPVSLQPLDLWLLLRQASQRLRPKLRAGIQYLLTTVSLCSNNRSNRWLTSGLCPVLSQQQPSEYGKQFRAVRGRKPYLQ